MKKVYFAFALLLCISHFAQSQSTINYNNWQIVFQDEFNGYTNTTDLTNKWRLDYPWGPTLTGNATENQYYTPSNISFTNDNIVFTAQKQTPPIIFNWEENGVQKTKELDYTSGMLFSKVAYDQGCWDGNIGFTHGMFEIRCKMPKGVGTWPAFWLYSGPTEIDVFEFYDDKRMFTTTVHNWNNNGNHTGCSNHFKKSLGKDLTEEFHNYACIWDDQKVRIFFDSVEVWSTSREYTHSCPATIIVNLAMTTGATMPSTSFVVDYVRTYKPIDNNNPVTNDYVWNKNFVVGSTIKLNKMSNVAHGMHFLEPNKLVIKSNTSKIKCLNKTNGTWEISEPNITYTSTNLVKDDVISDPQGNIYYKGKDNRIHTLEKNGTNYDYHLVDDGMLSSYSIVSATSGALLYANNKIFYRGKDNKLHTYEKINGVWQHQLVNINYTTTYLMTSNIEADQNGAIYYRGNTARIIKISNNGSGNYTQEIIGDASIADNDKVASGILNIAINGDDIIYHTKNHQIKKYTYLSGNWQLNSLNTTNTIPLTKKALRCSTNGNIYYMDNVGKLSILVKNGNIYTHEYPSSWGAESNQTLLPNENFLPSDDGSIYFVNSTLFLQQFLKENYIGANVVCDENDYTPQPIFRQTQIKKNQYNIFPNPAKNTLFIETDEAESEIQIFDIQGRLYYTKKLILGVNTLDIGDLGSGLYLYKLSNGEFGKFVKEE